MSDSLSQSIHINVHNQKTDVELLEEHYVCGVYPTIIWLHHYA